MAPTPFFSPWLLIILPRFLCEISFESRFQIEFHGSPVRGWLIHPAAGGGFFEVNPLLMSSFIGRNSTRLCMRLFQDSAYLPGHHIPPLFCCVSHTPRLLFRPFDEATGHSSGISISHCIEKIKTKFHFSAKLSPGITFPPGSFPFSGRDFSFFCRIWF